MPIDIDLTEDQIEEIREVLTGANNLATDERQLLNALLEMAQNHPGVERAWTFHHPNLSEGN